jgi:hypothetical protein
LARQAGLAMRVNAEARRAVNALERADGASLVMLAAAVDALADLVQETEPELADMLREHVMVPRPDRVAGARRRRGRSLAMPDVAAPDTRPGGASGGPPPGWLDPRLIPPGIFQHAVWPDAELAIRTEKDGIVVEARLAPGADRREIAHCHARLVDAENRTVIGTAPFVSLGDSRARAEIREPVPPGHARVEVVDDVTRPVSSSQLYHTRRAMRWAQTALSAVRRVCGLADAEWVRLAAEAWGRCAEDWAAAGDQDRAFLAAMRRAAICPGAATPEEPSAWAKEVAGRPLLIEEPFLAERLVSRRF